jgi:OOP family OmpA-OmpF porin
MSFAKIAGAMALLLIGAGFCGPAAGEEEPNWAQQLVRPVEGTKVHHNETVGYGRSKFVTGPAVKGAISAVAALEGKTSEISYTGTSKNSPFEIFSVYKNYLKQNKYEIVFACEKAECGEGFKGLWYGLNPFERLGDATPILHASEGNQHYIAAKKNIAGKDTYVSVLVFIAGWWNIPLYIVNVAQPGGLETDVVPASKIAEAMLNEGRIAMYGITFDSGKSEIKPESEGTLAELAAFLKADGGVFYVVGHTDGEGSLADNMNLAQARAAAVKGALTGKYGVPAALLSAHGAGPLSPLAANSTEEGRALNRRVEIVTAAGKARPGAVTAQPAAQPASEILSTGPKPAEPSPAQAALAAAQAKVAAAKVQVAQADTKKAEAKTMPEKIKATAEKMKADAALRAATQELTRAQAQARTEALPAKN